MRFRGLDLDEFYQIRIADGPNHQRAADHGARRAEDPRGRRAAGGTAVVKVEDTTAGEDEDGDGRADTREVWLEGFGGRDQDLFKSVIIDDHESAELVETVA